MEVEINQISTYPTSLRFGLVVRYSDQGPVRFASAYVNEDVLSPEVCRDLLDWCVRALNRALDSEPADEPLPLEGLQ